MRIALVIAGLLVSLVAQPQEIYRWVDSNGIVHYADQPGAPDAKRVEYAAPSDEDATDESPQLYRSGPAQPAERAPYRSLSIVSPTPDEVFFGGDVSVAVTVQLDARLRAGDELLIFVDGNRVPDVTATGATITGLARGTHFLRAAVADANGAVDHQQSSKSPSTCGRRRSPRRPPGRASSRHRDRRRRPADRFPVS